MKRLLLNFCLLISTSTAFAQLSPNDFVFTVQTDFHLVEQTIVRPNFTNDSSYLIPVDTSFNYLFDVDWDNDGVFDDFAVSDSIIHSYPTPGTYTIRIRGQYPKISLGNIGTHHYDGDHRKLVSIDQWGGQVWETFEGAFYGCSQLNSLPSAAPMLDSVKSMSSAFENATNFNQSINHWDVSSIQDLSKAFKNARSFNQPLDQWNVSNVRNMSEMFALAYSFNQLIDQWDVSNVTDMSHMFLADTSYNQPINNWDVSSVTTMEKMFEDARKFDQALSSWQTTSVTNMNSTFRGAASFDQAINNWDVSNVTDMSYMFQRARSFNQPLDSWNTSNVSKFIYQFYMATSYDQPIKNWNLTGTFSAIDPFFSMLDHSGMSNESFDTTLITLYVGRQFQGGHYNSTLGALGINHCPSWAYDSLVRKGWIIQGVVPNCDTTVFITIWNTAIADNNLTDFRSIELYCDTTCSYNFDIDWESDGIYDTLGVTSTIQHTYDFAGIYTVTIRGQFPCFKAKDPRVTWVSQMLTDDEKLIGVPQWGDQVWTSLEYALSGRTYLSVLDKESPILDSITSLKGLFAGSRRITEGGVIDISSWDVSRIKDFSNMFYYYFDSVPSIGNWDVSSATNMASMFERAWIVNLNLSSWDVSKVTNMSKMFYVSGFNQPLNSWDVSSVTDMSHMLSFTAFNRPLNNWNVSNVTYMTGMFRFSSFDQPLDSWDVSNVNDMAFMFVETPFNQPLNNWNVSNVKDMTGMFGYTKNFNQSLANWNVSKVERMREMFYGTEAFNQPIESWDVSAVTDFSRMFAYSTVFDQSLNLWNTSSATNMREMFQRAMAFNQPIDNWDVSSVTTMERMFERCKSFDQALHHWDYSSILRGDAMRFMLDSSALSISNYDSLLMHLAKNHDTLATELGSAGLKYCNGFFARDTLVQSGWTFKGDAVGCLIQRPESDFVFSINTNNPGSSNDSSFVLHIDTSFNYSYSIDWDNDSIYDTLNVQSSFLHTFPAPGSYTIRINGQFPALNFNAPNNQKSNNSDEDKLITVEQWGDHQWESLEGAFLDCDSLEGLPAEAPDLSRITSLERMFKGSSFDQSVANWDVSGIQDMSEMFAFSTFNQPLDSWDFSSVTSLDGFLDSSALVGPLFDSLLFHLFNNYPLLQLDVGSAGMTYCKADSIRTLMMNNGWTFNGSVKDCSIGLKELERKDSFSMFPNPTSGTIWLRGGKEIIGERLLIIDHLGRLVMELRMTQEFNEINLESLESGVYYLRLGNASQKLVIK